MLIQLSNCTIFDGSSAQLIEGGSVIIEGDVIKEVSQSGKRLERAQSVDCKGMFLMPGLIDAHYHAYMSTFNVAAMEKMPWSLMACHAHQFLERSLEAGFTTVRDAGGADAGLEMALAKGLIAGPRLFYSGRVISQTGGHGDLRGKGETSACSCSLSGKLEVIVDGETEMRKAVREELRRGAHQIKIFVSGGVISPSDPIWMPQFTEAEIRAAVEEAATRRTYVMAHCHTDDSARRCVEYGVRTIEHATEISAPTAALIAEKGAYVVPTLTILKTLRDHGPTLNLPSGSVEKIDGLFEQSLRSIERCAEAGVKIGLGTDLVGEKFYSLQGGELSLRGEVQKPIDVLRSATSVNAAILQKDGLLGTVSAGAYADLILLRRNPLDDLSQFSDPGKNMPLIMKAGSLIRNEL
ncbi:metal-dependent hydrolase family protein [Kineobactrum salinum]|uniref:Amidohydrolase family protein n=1 Tax=Kineobactrum salinum TaxID=2708301 RepID=A0A6C0U942_9GAMM|nr:amidohydrolase family protein [Kineobactrum salinum]QIB66114.1 amidohydrolase family protein [Kineobactrum salinum]